MYINFRKILVLIILLSLLAACETPYKSLRASARTQNALAHNTNFGRLKKIAFYGNGYLKKEKTQIYALYRSAEYARLANKAYFVLYPTLYAAAKGSYTHMPVVTKSGIRSHAFSFVYLSDVYIPGAHKTSDVLEQYKSQLKKSKIRGAAHGTSQLL